MFCQKLCFVKNSVPKMSAFITFCPQPMNPQRMSPQRTQFRASSFSANIFVVNRVNFCYYYYYYYYYYY